MLKQIFYGVLFAVVIVAVLMLVIIAFASLDTVTH